MKLLSLLYCFIIEPLVLLFDIVFSKACTITRFRGLSIIILSIVVNLLALPLYIRADSIQDQENKKKKKIEKWEKHIKKHFKGEERFLMLQTFYITQWERL